MMRFAFRLLLLVFLLPWTAGAQDLERVTPSDSQFGLPAWQEREDPGEPEPFHVTPLLIDSEEGRRTLDLFRQYRREGYYEREIRLYEVSEIGDVRLFTVRNIEQSLDGEVVFDEKEFELVRIADNLEIGGSVEIWVEREELSPDRINETVLDQIYDGLTDRTPPASVSPDRGVVEIGRSLFGEQPDVEGTGVLRILIVDIEDGWGVDDQSLFTAGFFDPVNLLPVSQNPNSNQADIIYINSVPGIYRPGYGVVSDRLNTIAHELQHLIHANYDSLSLFQNEGQSELAEILSGYSARAMNFLNLPGEVKGEVAGGEQWLYRFRTTAGDLVLYDYQRAQLLHSYFEERVGADEAGALTRSDRTMDAAYREILDRNGITLQEFFSGFWLAAYANRRLPDGNFGFSRVQLANVRVSNPGRFYHSGVQPWVRGREETIHYGGALYTEWFGLEDLSLRIEPESGVRHELLYRKEGETEFVRQNVQGGTVTLEQDQRLYEQVVLVSVNVSSIRSTPDASESRTYRYSADWTPTDLITEELSYHGEAAAFAPLSRDAYWAFAQRISPHFEASVRTVRFQVHESEGAVQGDGELRVTLREADPLPGSPEAGIRIPGELLTSQPVSLNDLSVGGNYIGVDSESWQVDADREYFVSLEVADDRGGLLLELLFDEGVDINSNDQNPDYTPVRTWGGREEDGEIARWEEMRFENRERLNLMMGTTLVGFREEPRPDFPEPPIAEDFELLQNYPNPFRFSTRIEFSLPEDAEIQITLHDILGRAVDELHSGQTPAGLHGIEYDPTGLASGIYFYRMNYPGGVATRRMTLIR